jgi:GR25 family glycosyltransferase involved in LPS biosynthesis
MSFILCRMSDETRGPESRSCWHFKTPRCVEEDHSVVIAPPLAWACWQETMSALFATAFCINVCDGAGRARGEARWARMERRWQRVTATEREVPLPPLSRFKATTPEDLPTPPAAVFAAYLSPLQRACAWSHRRVWGEIWERGLDAALVVEDDVVFRRGWASEVAAFSHRPADFDLLLLNAAEEVLPVETWLPAREQCLTGAYVISRRGASQLLELTREMVWASDWSTQLLQARGRSWTRFPWLAIQEGADSFLQPGHRPAVDAAKVRRLLEAHAGPTAIREQYVWDDDEEEESLPTDSSCQ